MKSPAFQFYAGDFLVGVMAFSDEEVGIYIKMLAYQWEHGFLPGDRKLIKKIINSKRIPSENVMQKFEISEDGNLRNKRLESERRKQESFRESRAENAKKRWKKEPEDDARASDVHVGSICKTDALQSSSSPSGMNKKEVTPPSARGGASSDPEPAKPAEIGWVLSQGFTGISDADLAVWAQAYPAVNLRSEISRASEWLRSNPAKRKKAVRRFLTNWLSRSQERGGDRSQGAPRSRHSSGYNEDVHLE